MQHKLLLPYLLTALVLLGLVAQSVFAFQYGTVQITAVNAPTSVGADQPVTVSITISYDFTQPLLSESLLVALMSHTETGNPYPILGSTNCYPASESGLPSSQSVCIAETNASNLTPSVITVSFTLTAPTTPQTWQPTALASIVVTGGQMVMTPEETAYQNAVITVT
jgi:hypothetical protein